MASNVTSVKELIELTEFCHNLFVRHRSIDYYATTIGIGLVVVFGIFGNAGTLLTLSGRRLTTATFVYYRAIACTDLIRCFFVLSYVLRVVIPFRNYFGATWYEAHLMYFIINTLSFVSTSLAVTLCVRLCIGILQSRRLKKTKTNPKTTRIFVYLIVGVAIAINFCLCFEYDAVNVSSRIFGNSVLLIWLKYGFKKFQRDFLHFSLKNPFFLEHRLLCQKSNRRQKRIHDPRNAFPQTKRRSLNGDPFDSNHHPIGSNMRRRIDFGLLPIRRSEKRLDSETALRSVIVESENVDQRPIGPSLSERPSLETVANPTSTM